ncbi:MAG: tetratricopeptide repeat-containing protein [Hyphomicrobiales bacterium]|nr:tetratricopeptide repeat-containing protein [Hyphomicrobiales bacterium]MCP4998797.1 tetratricopeptide repeat-containing protein [Hyphomicrobiales bacterium]
MSAQHISACDADTELAMARKAGWRPADLNWERLQEQGNAHLLTGNRSGATRCFRRAGWIALWRFGISDPRRATTLANLALTDRLAGHEASARRRYAKARKLWDKIDTWIDGMQAARRARSSLFHLRMEARHWETYQDNMRNRMRAFAAETSEAMSALEQGKPPPHRLYERWRGEKPSVFDDTRKFLAAALLVGAGGNYPSSFEG